MDKLEEAFNYEEKFQKSNETIGPEEMDSLFAARDKLRQFV